MLFLLKKHQKLPKRSYSFGTKSEIFRLKEQQLIFQIPRGRDRKPYSLKIGENLHNFYLENIDNLNDFSITAYNLKHKNGARFLHLDSNELMNCFALLIKTDFISPEAQRIFSHLATLKLKQSIFQKSLFNFKEPTLGSSYIYFPFETTNISDFYNLLNLYCETLFFPKFNKNSFLNEIHHFSLILEEKQDKLLHKGNLWEEIFKEEQLSEHILYNIISENLFEQKKITSESLSQMNFESFLNEINKLKNDCFYFYSFGDLDFTNHLQFLQEYLEKAYPNSKTIKMDDENTKKTDNLLQKFPKDIIEKVPPNPSNTNNEVQFAISYQCPELTHNNLLLITFHFLSYILFELPSSPLLSEILEVGLAPSYSCHYGLEISNINSAFTIGVQGIQKENINEIEKKINEILVSEINENLIEEAFAKIEINAKWPKKEFINEFFESSSQVFVNDGDPLFFLKVSENLKKLKEKIKKDKNYLNTVIRKYLVENNNKIRIILSSDQDFIQEKIYLQQRNLEKKMKSLSESIRNEIKDNNENLQKKVVDNNKIEIVLEKKEIDPRISEIIIDKYEINNCPVFWFEENTNGITFLRMKFDLKGISEELRKNLMMFCL